MSDGTFDKQDRPEDDTPNEDQPVSKKRKLSALKPHGKFEWLIVAFFGLFATIFVGVILLFIVSIVATPFISHFTTTDVTISVNDKERVTDRGGEDARYIVWATVTEEDGTSYDETFEVTDALWKWKFNASDTYGALEVGKAYKVEVNWFRWGVTSSYRNVLTVYEEVKR